MKHFLKIKHISNNSRAHLYINYISDSAWDKRNALKQLAVCLINILFI